MVGAEEAWRRQDRERSCTGKRKFGTQATAAWAAGQATKSLGVRMTHYLCRHCPYYHMATYRGRSEKW